MTAATRNPAGLPVAMVVLWAQVAAAQTESDLGAAAADVPPPSSEEEVVEEEEIEWSFSASVLGYLVPDDRDFAQPTFSADRDWLHLEARYNYEELNTGSAWVGFNFSFGEELKLDFTPMIGGVFGELNGVAPGYEATLSWWKLELYTEGEYVIDVEDHSGNFFYTWSELSLAPLDWFRFGLVVQRTKAYETDFDIQRGLLAGFSYEPVDFTAYVLNLGWDTPTVVLSLGIGF